MGTKNNPGTYDCYEKGEPDEPMFVLLARDPKAADLVRMWAALREGNSHGDTFKDAAKIREAMQCADAMDEWRKAYSERRMAELKQELHELKARVRAQEWVSVEDRPIPKGDDVLLRFKTGLIAQGSKRYGQLGEPKQDEFAFRTRCCGKFSTPTHWMPLPPPPEEPEQ